jgi:hypothetical protein
MNNSELIIPSMSLAEKLTLIKARIFEYQHTDVYRLNTSSKINVAAIMLMVSFTEFGLYDRRQVREEEKAWFDGGTILIREFDNDTWSDIATLYIHIVDEVKDKHFFH